MTDTVTVEQPQREQKIEELECEYYAIASEAETYFKRPDVEADWRVALKQPEYLALVGRYNKSNAEAKAVFQVTNLRSTSASASAAYRGLRAYKKINTRLKARRDASTRQRPPLENGDIYASEVQKEYGVTLAKLNAIADQAFEEKLAYWGVSSGCPYGSAEHAHQVEEAKRKGKVVCICQLDFNHPMYPHRPVGPDLRGGRKVYSRSAIEALINNEKLRRTKKVISFVPSPTCVFQ